MTVLESIDYAIKETLKKYPDFDISLNLCGYLNEEIGTIAFTRNNGARECIKNISKDEIVIEILKQSIKVGLLYDYYVKNGYHEQASQIPGGQDCYQYIQALKADCDSYVFPTSSPTLMRCLVNSFVSLRYHDKTGILSNTKNITLGSIEDKLRADCKANSKYSNLQVHSSTVNKCKQDILSGAQIRNSHNEYELDGELYAVNDVGKRRTNQEDSVLILTHPKNKSFKLLVVSDGMGGVSYGELASAYTITAIMKWFESLPENMYTNELYLETEFYLALQRINTEFCDEFRDKYGRLPGATFSGAIVCNNKTIVANVGDSRVYAGKNGEVHQITRDDSVVQKMLDSGEILDKEGMRFHKLSNVLTQCIGRDGGINPRMITLDNNMYDLLMIFSDGVTDCLSDDQIKFITQTTSKEELAREIVRRANNTDSRNLGVYSEDYHAVIPGGKDNESAIVYTPNHPEQHLERNPDFEKYQDDLSNDYDDAYASRR